MLKTMLVTIAVTLLAIPSLCPAADTATASARYAFSTFTEHGFDTNEFTFGSDGFVSDGSDISSPKAKYCSRAMSLTCVEMENEALIFAIPNHDLKPGDKWWFHGRWFGLIGHTDEHGPIAMVPGIDPALWKIKLLNKEMLVYVVGSGALDGKSPSQIYLYSREYGLVAFMDVAAGPQNVTWWLEEGYGLGSEPFMSKVTGDAYLTADEYKKMTAH